MRLLLAEDEEDLNKALGAVLKHNNYSVDAVYNGQDAVSTIVPSIALCIFETHHQMHCHNLSPHVL